MNDKIITSIRVPVPILDILDDYSKGIGMTKSELIEHIVSTKFAEAKSKLRKIRYPHFVTINYKIENDLKKEIELLVKETTCYRSYSNFANCVVIDYAAILSHNELVI